MRDLIYDRALTKGEIEHVTRVDYQNWMKDYDV